MTWLTNNWRVVLVAGLILLCVSMANLVGHYHTLYNGQVKANQHLQRDNDQQGAVIATQAFQFNRFNEIAARQQQYAVTLTGKAQEKEIEYRTILKSEPTCALAVPAAIAGRLLDYTNRLRTSAMHAYPGLVDEANAGTAAPGTLTYCQAVLWIDQLLTVIDIGNGQFTDIREVDKTRASH